MRRRLYLLFAAFGLATGAFWLTMLEGPPRSVISDPSRIVGQGPYSGPIRAVREGRASLARGREQAVWHDNLQPTGTFLHSGEDRRRAGVHKQLPLPAAQGDMVPL